MGKRTIFRQETGPGGSRSRRKWAIPGNSPTQDDPLTEWPGIKILRRFYSEASQHTPLFVRILLVEDQTMVRELLASECARMMPEAAVVAVGTGAAALTEFRHHPPDLMILDLRLPDSDGIALWQQVYRAAPQVKVIVLSSHIDEYTLHRALRARVHGIIDKNEQPIRILSEAMATVLSGRQYISSAVQRLRALVREDPTAFDKILSNREQEILRYIGEGLNNEQIAQVLEITELTAKRHRHNIMAKLGVHSTPKLIRYAISKGFTQVPESPIGPSG